MKCDELKPIHVPAEMCGESTLAEAFDYYERKPVDEAIAELKDKIQMHDFFWEGCGFEKRGFKNAIAVAQHVEYLEAQNESLLFALNEAVAKQGFKNLNIPESLTRMMRELADAKGENRRQQHELRATRRALWLSRAYRAEARKNYWYARSCHEGDKELLSIDGSPVKYIGCIKRTNFEWLKIWSEVEIKCLKKAEEYK